jgi:hypothetical protein
VYVENNACDTQSTGEGVRPPEPSPSSPSPRSADFVTPSRPRRGGTRERIEQTAAVVIQRYWRGVLGRRKAAERRKAVVDIQRWWKVRRGASMRRAG